MPTQTTNRIAVDVTEEMIKSGKIALENLDRIFSFLIGLTPEERQSLPKIDVNNKVFVDDAIIAAENNPQIFPAYFRVDDMKQDKTGYDRLDELVTLTNQWAQKLRDTQLLMGSEAYISALTIYRLMESAARDGVPGAQATYNQLAERFKYQGSTKEDAPSADSK